MFNNCFFKFFIKCFLNFNKFVCSYEEKFYDVLVV